jgi:hypothetical protein
LRAGATLAGVRQHPAVTPGANPAGGRSTATATSTCPAAGLRNAGQNLDVFGPELTSNVESPALSSSETTRAPDPSAGPTWTTAASAAGDAQGSGATLDWTSIRPAGPTDRWIWQVVPKWRRSPGGKMLPYDNATNSAQEKLFSVHLVLAALLASPDPHGRVLILDELGDSLGDEHRRDVLQAVRRVAEQHGITVLGTCQDAVMPDAASYCGEILYFCYPSKTEALNLPTRMFAYDSNRARVELTAEALLAGRPWT